MRQRQIIKEAAEQVDIKQSEAKEIIESCISAISDNILSNNKIDIPDFGTFSLIKQKEKNASIPGKEQKVIIPEHYKLQFKVSESLKSEIQGLEK